MYTSEAMKGRLAIIGPALALAILVGCQGGDASGSDAAPPTAYTAVHAYAGNSAHPIAATNGDVVARAAEEELERRVNEYRNGRGLDGLKIIPELRELALAHAVHMGRHEPAFFDHINPEGHTPENRAEGWIDFVAIGENIAAGQSAAEAVFQAWLASPSHRANLEDPRWTHMGAGHAFLPESPYVTYWTLELIEQR
jgi:uncharacterized protein YkwD